MLVLPTLHCLQQAPARNRILHPNGKACGIEIHRVCLRLHQFYCGICQHHESTIPDTDSSGSAPNGLTDTQSDRKLQHTEIDAERQQRRGIDVSNTQHWFTVRQQMLRQIHALTTCVSSNQTMADAEQTCAFAFPKSNPKLIMHLPKSIS